MIEARENYQLILILATKIVDFGVNEFLLMKRVLMESYLAFILHEMVDLGSKNCLNSS